MSCLSAVNRNDLSYRNYLYSGYGYGFGYLLKNAVYLSLRRAGYQVYVGSIKDSEVDLVAIKGDKKNILISYTPINRRTNSRKRVSFIKAHRR